DRPAARRAAPLPAGARRALRARVPDPTARVPRPRRVQRRRARPPLRCAARADHPATPRTARVRAQCDAAAAALVRAAAPERRERVQTAQRLQGRVSANELADLLGVTAHTVRRYWRAVTCARCGGPQLTASASSCADCIPYLAQRRPSRTTVIRALRRWARET